jgi:hypothetical protein
MAKLIGTNPNQVPSNADLGTAAFMDKEEFLSSRGNSLAKIKATLANTPYRVFVYDTRKDSDGGAWRKRTSHTSWYNEKLNTPIRGSRREFPAVVVIILETDTVTFYDADDPDLSMWMVWEQSGILTWASGTTSTEMSGHMLNAKFAWGTDERGGGIADFAKDEVEFFHGDSQSYDPPNPRIGDRAVAGFYSPGNYLIGHPEINDLTMTVLPNAAIDPTTNLPIPTIAIAHDNGVSIVRDDKSIIEKSGSNYITIDSFGDYFIAKTAGDDLSVVPWLDNDPVINYTKGAYRYNGNKATGYYPYLYGNGGALLGTSDDRLAQLTGVTGITMWDIKNIDNARNVLQANIRTGHNTGWMHGDTRLAILNDITDTGMIYGSELLNNGDFENGYNFWTLVSSTASITNGTTTNMLTLTGTAPTGHAYQEVDMVAGHQYTISGYIDFGSTFGAGFQVYNGTTLTTVVGVSRTSNGDGYYSGRYTATVTGTHQIRLYHSVSSGTGFTIKYDNISVRRSVFDKSTHNFGGQIVGSFKKNLVAPGSDLVSYQLLTSSSRIQIPYSTQFDFGTGDWSFSGWIKSRSTNNYSDIISRGDVGDVGYASAKNGSWFLQLYGSSGGQPQRALNFYYKHGNSLLNVGWTDFGLPYNEWCHVVLNKTRSEIKIYINNKIVSTGDVGDANFSISGGTNADMVRIGWQGSSYNFPSVDEEFALFKLSATAYSREQIERVYHDEKSLLEPDAKAGLYGTTDAVSSFAYDEDTKLLYVGTTSGRSDFQRLRRVNNTEESATKISASNGLIVD